jgi:hypothetical protein
MLLDDLDPAEQEALSEVEDARRALELAETRLFLVAGRKRRRQSRPLYIVPPPEALDLCEGRR